MSIKGDPEKLVNYVLEKNKEQVQRELEKAYNDAYNLLKDYYDRVLEELKNEINHLYLEALDSIKSLESSLEKDIKIEVSQKKAEFLTKVMEEVKNRFFQLSKDQKRNVYGKLLKDFLERAPENTSFVIESSKEDVSIIKGLTRRKEIKDLFSEKKISLEFRETEKQLEGGFIAVGLDQKITYDYTFELIFDSLKPFLLGIASKELFGEKNE